MFSLRSCGPEGQECLVLFICDPGEIHCHSDLLILQQKWTLRLRLQKDLPCMLVLKKTRNNRAGPPRGYRAKRPGPVYPLELECWREESVIHQDAKLLTLQQALRPHSILRSRGLNRGHRLNRQSRPSLCPWVCWRWVAAYEPPWFGDRSSSTGSLRSVPAAFEVPPVTPVSQLRTELFR
ncbi:hypothetical protein NDU88_000075 [Pleurodeles waltl]|uniref:Uncharacterized protein n=1 Tax=Pleurodeles waltl TaxID=8319 RepID=A0AAV7L8V7_PLEWA|nr:hypothetical protein NDU88_000075 [Pleurodeles waltl]